MIYFRINDNEYHKKDNVCVNDNKIIIYQIYTICVVTRNNSENINT